VRNAEVVIPERAPTGAETLIALAPAGADAMLEIDLARLRENRAVGELVRALTHEDEQLAHQFNAVRDAKQVLLCSYGIGGATQQQLVLLSGVTEEIPGALRLSDDVVALGSDQALARADAVARGQESGLSGDRELLRLRALAMPEKAQGAAVRGAARLGFNARVALAAKLNLDAVPVSISLWGDVADDLALVALLGAEKDKEARALATAAEHVRDRLVVEKALRRLAVGHLLRRAQVEVHGKSARVLLLIGPARLSRIVARLLAALGRETPE
jgi:hypothetical protein